MARQLLPPIIVPEVLRGVDNFKAWSASLRSYMLAQDLWDVVTKPPEQTEEVKDWEKRNAAALHAIQVSCGPDALSSIEGIIEAKKAWQILEVRYRQGPNLLDRYRTVDGDELVSHLPKLQRHVSSGNLEATKSFFNEYPEAIKKLISPEAGTALHVAVKSGHLKIVEELLRLMTEEADLEITDSNHYTALEWAVATDNMDMVKCMLPKYKSLSPSSRPLLRACEWGQATMASHLYQIMISEINPDDWYPDEAIDVIKACIEGRIFDIALDLLSNTPAYEEPSYRIIVAYAEILETLSKFPGLFLSGCRLSFWQRWIYTWIRIQPFVPYHCSAEINCKSKPRPVTKRVLNIAPRLVEAFLEFLGIKQICKLKYNHVRLLELIDCLSPYIGQYFYKSQLQFLLLRAHEEDYMEALELANLPIDRTLMNAVKFGIVEIVMFISNLLPDLPPSCQDENRRTILESSIKYRQEKVFGYFVPILLQARNVVPPVKNPIYIKRLLHLAGELSPSSKLSCISGAALQMQWELQWYNKVESLIRPQLRDNPNNDGETAREVFTREHKELREAGEVWMTSKATSCTVVGALIITVMFAAAFTVPRGLDQSSGLPFFRENKWFKVFIISDAISLFTSSTSVLMFLGILTSRYAEQDFLKSLPTKLIIGISTLLLSIVAMMVAFCASLILMLGGQRLVLVLIVSLAAVPVITFMSTQFPLLLDIYKSTYSSSIFEYRKESYPIVIQLIKRRANKAEKEPNEAEKELWELQESILGDAIV